VTHAADGRTVEILSAMIRNACVNDGDDHSGAERRNAELVASLLPPDTYEMTHPSGLPERASLIARVEGKDPNAPTLLLLGHTDVVPVNPRRWDHDPFGGEIINGEIWGRGSVDMLNQTSAMATAFANIASGRNRLNGTLIFAAVADEEAGGENGILHVLRERPGLLRCDAVLGEGGGPVARTPSGPVIGVAVAEKGTAPTRIVVHGRGAHASIPRTGTNALVIAAEVVNRIATARPATHIDDTWRDWITETVHDEAVRSRLLDRDRLWDYLESLPGDHGSYAHACTHTTYTPTTVSGGTTGNVLPDRVTLGLDVRIVPGETSADVERFLGQLLADLPVTITIKHRMEPNRSDRQRAVWMSLQDAAGRAHPDGRVAPMLFSGATDGRHLRTLGVPVFGFGVLSSAVDPTTYWHRFHGDNERIDLESLRLSTMAWEQVARDFLA
jgi:acetylornithine deacetylase/succinyl-diaminopimelate desuccinylase-like protein